MQNPTPPRRARLDEPASTQRGEPQARQADTLVEGSSRGLGSKFKLIANTQVKLWKALLLIMFIAGFVAALTWAVGEQYLRGDEDAALLSESEAAASTGIELIFYSDGTKKLTKNGKLINVPQGSGGACPYAFLATNPSTGQPLVWPAKRIDWSYSSGGGLSAATVEAALRSAYAAWDNASGLQAPNVKHFSGTPTLYNKKSEIGWYIDDPFTVAFAQPVDEQGQYWKEFDVWLNSNAGWTQYKVIGDPDTFQPLSTGRFDLQNFMTMIFGYGVGLNGVFGLNPPETEQTMYVGTDYDEVKKRSLECGDNKGIKVLYGKF